MNNPETKHLEITKDDRELFCSRMYHSSTKEVMEKGITRKSANNRSNNYYISSFFKCAQTEYQNRSHQLVNNEHWDVKEIHPLGYYGKEYDPQKDYYEEILRMDNLTSLRKKMESKKNQLQIIENKIINYQDAIKYEENRVKLVRKEIKKLQLAIDINTQYKK
jgi:hypothetical protein